jgi:TRAP transporter 4TM/12TM fusion protein
MTPATELPPPGRVANALPFALMLAAAAISVFHLWSNLTARVAALPMAVAHFALLGTLGLLAVAGTDSSASRRTWLVQRVPLAVALAIASIAVIVLEQPLYERSLEFGPGHWLATIAVIALAIELTRRSAGNVIPLLIALALSYATIWGSWIGGVFAFPGLSWETMLYRSVYTDDGMFGSIARISWSYVYVFVLFGTFLVRSGGADLILALASAAAGRVTGGPGLVAVGASGLMGSVTGSAIANTVATGSVTIPLMKNAGFPPRFAAATEAAASTGGQLMPPVMGAGAFLMANFTGLPYLEIIAAALIPALLYFLSVGVHVRIEALRCGIAPSAAPSGESALTVLTRNWPLLAPLAVLIALLVAGFTPVYAGAGAIAAVVVFSWLTPARMGPIAIVEALAGGARAMVPTAMLMIAVGLIVNVITTTGIGSTFSLMITEWAGASLLASLALVALASLVLGMGLPVTAAYIVLAAIAAPALQTLLTQAELIATVARGELTDVALSTLALVDPGAVAAGMPMAESDARILVLALAPELQQALIADLLDPALLAASLLTAHMIVFWLSQDSNVTPPVALAAFAAAGIADTRPMPAGVTAWKLAKGLYVIPLLFAYTPLLTGTWSEVLPLALAVAAGLYAFAGLLDGYLEGPLNAPLRCVAGAAALLLLWPGSGWAGAALGAGLLAVLIVLSRRRRPQIAFAARSATINGQISNN